MQEKKKLTDEQRAIVERNLGLARLAVIRTQALRARAHISDEDGFCAACEGLVNGARLYNPEKSAESTYLYPAALNSVVMECRKALRLSRSLMKTVSIDAPTASGDGRLLTLADTLAAGRTTEECFSLQEDVSVALGAMSALERRCVLLSLAGHTQLEIGRQVGCEQSNVSRIIQRGKRKAREALLA